MIFCSDHIEPVGFEGEFIIIPLIFLLATARMSFISGSKLFFDSVSIKTGVASDKVTNSGKDTQ